MAGTGYSDPEKNMHTLFLVLWCIPCVQRIPFLEHIEMVPTVKISLVMEIC